MSVLFSAADGSSFDSAPEDQRFSISSCWSIATSRMRSSASGGARTARSQTPTRVPANIPKAPPKKDASGPAHTRTPRNSVSPNEGLEMHTSTSSWTRNPRHAPTIHPRRSQRISVWSILMPGTESVAWIEGSGSSSSAMASPGTINPQWGQMAFPSSPVPWQRMQIHDTNISSAGGRTVTATDLPYRVNVSRRSHQSPPCPWDPYTPAKAA